jgi:plastocyanin
MKRLLLLATLFLMAMLIFVSVAAGAQKQATNEAGAHKPAKKTVLIKPVLIQDFSFSPAKIVVKKGTKVIWVNTDAAPHTVTANNGAFDSGVLQRGETFTRTFRKAGKFAYHCEIHPEMVGSVRVKQRWWW